MHTRFSWSYGELGRHRWLFWAGRRAWATGIGLGTPTARTTPWPATRGRMVDLPRTSTGGGRTVRKCRIHNWHKKEKNTVKLVFEHKSYLPFACPTVHDSHQILPQEAATDSTHIPKTTQPCALPWLTDALPFSSQQKPSQPGITTPGNTARFFKRGRKTIFPRKSIKMLDQETLSIVMCCNLKSH